MMATNKTETFAEGRDLVLTRVFDAPRDKVFKAWTDPDLLKQWFTPAPWTTPVVETDVRAGGSNLIMMRGPDGNEFPNRGVYLEVVENERIVLTDAFTEAWEPSDKAFMTLVLSFEDQDGKTKYTARVKHWSVADREAHEQMGFHQGWAICAEQLAALVEKQ
ncbi:SRPBCC family protein [Herbaspirillum sp. GCM10030257]|uniref:SRPBCC family protein n=1 Tax=Herbaspirillum sp. GCM10030257 TaxID=3273393 RepID=UPI00360FFBEB